MADNVDRLLEALADPTRRRVVELLSDGPVRAGDLAAGVGLAPTAITRHLKALRDAGVVDVQSVDGDARGRLYRLRAGQLARLRAWIDGVLPALDHGATADDAPDSATGDRRHVDGRGDAAAFAAATEPLRGELRLHCYRMTGSLDESEDLLQDALLRAWRAWPQFRGDSSVRTWLYRITTNVCLSALEGRRGQSPARSHNPSTRPYPEPISDQFLPTGTGAERPDDQLVARETIELAFLAALRVLSPRQRAAFILRDLIGLPATATAEALDISVAATKSALQRARAALRAALSEDRMTWPAARPSSAEERAITRRYIAAIQDRDGDAMAELLHKDLRVTYLPRGLVVDGRATFIDGSTRYAPTGEFRYVETGANGQPAIAVYLRPPGATEFRRLSLAVLRVAGEEIVEIVDFSDPSVLESFGLPARLQP
ncbi:MAG TPA: RNA polymerase subunit sigma-70 [Micromonosporaceae bacterium]|nr:RNA polymerase subunit sigma-70 [Micromonosporaceae bacterium]